MFDSVVAGGCKAIDDGEPARSRPSALTAADVAGRLNEIRRAAPEVLAALMAVAVPVTADEGVALGDAVICNEHGKLTVLSLLNTMFCPTGTLIRTIWYDDRTVIEFDTIPVSLVKFAAAESTDETGDTGMNR